MKNSYASLQCRHVKLLKTVGTRRINADVFHFMLDVFFNQRARFQADLCVGLFTTSVKFTVNLSEISQL